MKYTLIHSQLGTVLLLARNDHLSGLDIFQDSIDCVRASVVEKYPEAVEKPEHFCDISDQLQRYFMGDQITFTEPIDLSDVTSFTKNVLVEVAKISYGHTRSYGAIAESLGCHGGARAVGQAVGRNPIPILVPCHRVIQTSGALGGFSMGLELKAKLLALEGIRLINSYKSPSFSSNSSH